MPIATHQISLHGLSGAIFWSILSALIFYVLGFATVGWESRGRDSWAGLWMTCSSSYTPYHGEDWFKATQAMLTIGLVLLLVATLCIFLYMFVHSLSISKNIVIKVFTGFIFFAVLFMLIGFILFGAKHDDRYQLHWSFAFAVIGGVLALVAGILGIVQMKQSNVM